MLPQVASGGQRDQVAQLQGPTSQLRSQSDALHIPECGSIAQEAGVSPVFIARRRLKHSWAEMGEYGPRRRHFAQSSQAANPSGGEKSGGLPVGLISPRYGLDNQRADLAGHWPTSPGNQPKKTKNRRQSNKMPPLPGARSPEASDAAWREALAKRKDRDAASERKAKTKWNEEVKPYLAQQTLQDKHFTRHGNSQRQRAAYRARKAKYMSDKKLKKKQNIVDQKGRRLLKDIEFLFERRRQIYETESMKTHDFTGERATLDKEALSAVEADIKALKQSSISLPRLWQLADIHKGMLTDLFMELDQDASGFLDLEEVRQLCLMLGVKLTPAELTSARDAMDGDGSGEIDFVEFYEWWQSDARHAVVSRQDSKEGAAMQKQMKEYMSFMGFPEGVAGPEREKRILLRKLRQAKHIKQRLLDEVPNPCPLRDQLLFELKGLVGDVLEESAGDAGHVDKWGAEGEGGGGGGRRGGEGGEQAARMPAHVDEELRRSLQALMTDTALLGMAEIIL